MSTRSSIIAAIRLIQDTFRQARASGILAIMFAVTAVCTLFCLSIHISGDASLYSPDEPALFLPPASAQTTPPDETPAQPPRPAYETDPELARREGIETISGHLSLGFGAVKIPLARDRRAAVQFLELLLAGGVGGILGLLLALVWTAGFVPAFLEPSTAAVLLTKPISRWKLLFAKYVGSLAFVAFHVTLFVALTWLAIGLRTQVWDLTYWWCVPLLLLQFAIFYSFSILLAVLTRSTAACVLGSLLYWLLAWGINYGQVMLTSVANTDALTSTGRALASTAYWIMPKPIDLGLILYNALNAQSHFAKPGTFTVLEASHTLIPALSCLSSLAITAAFLALAAHELNHTDY